jgi:hypothetical protein
MPTINLRKYYPLLTEDRFVEVSDEVAEAFLLAKRQKGNYHHRAWYHKAYEKVMESKARAAQKNDEKRPISEQLKEGAAQAAKDNAARPAPVKATEKDR